MNTYRLDISYDGTNYSGWQIQPHSQSIQELIQDAVRVLVKEEVKVIGSGRTDAGVHALGQVAHFRSEEAHDGAYLFKGLNGILPRDIRIKKVASVDPSFHAQRSAIAKEYHYRLCLGPIQSPFNRLYSWHVPYTLNLDILHEAAKLFIGTHDFSSFANSQHHGACAINPVRCLSQLDLIQEGEDHVLIFRANGFLYKMARNIVGMLIACASGKCLVSDIPTIFEAKDRKKAPSSAPAKGLCLIKVYY